MDKIYFRLRRLSFFCYFAILFALPFGFIANRTGSLIGLLVFATITLFLFATAKKRVVKRLRLSPIFAAEYPGLFAALNEYSRRFRIPLPEVHSIPTPALNAGVFSISRRSSLVFLTEGLLKQMSRQEISVLAIRLLLEIKSEDLVTRSWLCLFLQLFERPTTMEYLQNRSHTRRYYPVGVFFRQLVLYPLCWVPIQLAGVRKPGTDWDECAAAFSGDPRALSEGYRKMESYRARTPFFCPFAYHSLFISAPECLDPLAKVFVRTPSLSNKIARLEGRQLA